MQWQNWLNSQQQAVSSLEPLAGLTACSHLVTTNSQQRYVLRSQTARATDFGIDYQQEVQFLNLIAPLGFSPSVAYYDQYSSLLNWIEGTPPSKFNHQLIEQLANLVANLHLFDLQAVANLEQFTKLNLAERCQFLWNKLSSEQQATLGFQPPFLAISPFKQAICHHDIHLANLIQKNDKLFLIDWEYCAISDPALDLTMLVYSKQLTQIQMDYFLKHYFAKTGFDRTACMAKVEEYLPEVDKLNRLWFSLQAI
ncbi:LPS biosynthesis choline kinase [Pasteurellaceae bacterium 15-036681]|nr:LPS biosynthesis choline kinase [Pasteurellaceae bacterium 15-036681]